MKSKKIINICLIIYIVGICLACLSKFTLEPDYLWHLKVGEHIVKHGILRHDIFSWSMNGKYWMSHEWLFEVYIYCLKIVFGRFHRFFYVFSCSFGLMLFLLFTNKNNIKKNLLFSILWLSMFCINIFYIQIRPHLLSNVFLAITVYCLFDLYKDKKSKKVYLLPIISILWANMHGGSSNLPYLMCLLFIIGGLFNFKVGKLEAKRIDSLQLKKYIIVCILCMICVCINIHGFKMLIYPYQNMLDKTMITNITEWRPTSLNELSNYIYYALIVFIVLVMLLSKRKINFIDFIIFGFCIFLGLKSVRFWFYTYIIMSYIVYNYVGKYEVDNSIIIGLGIFSIIFIGMFIFSSKKIFSSDYHVFLKQKDINYIKSLKLKRLFNMYNYGGELIYNDIDVFIDGRADLYSGDVFDDYINMANLDGDFYCLLLKYNFDYYLVDKNYNIDFYLRYNSNYELLYENGNVKVYKKRVNV